MREAEKVNISKSPINLSSGDPNVYRDDLVLKAWFDTWDISSFPFWPWVRGKAC